MTKCASGSRTSPAILLTSHHPANEMNAPIKAIPRAGKNESDPGRCDQNGVRLAQSPRPSPKPHTTRKPSKPIFKA